MRQIGTPNPDFQCWKWIFTNAKARFQHWKRAFSRQDVHFQRWKRIFLWREVRLHKKIKRNCLVEDGLDAVGGFKSDDA